MLSLLLMRHYADERHCFIESRPRSYVDVVAAC